MAKISKKIATLAALAASAACVTGQTYSPETDPFFQSPSGFEVYAPGSILRQREVPYSLNVTYSKAYQLLYRTNNALGGADVSVTTVIVPKNVTSNALVSIQQPEDASYIRCAPSYTLHETTDTMVQAILDLGIVVNYPDYEGQDSAFTAGIQSGQMTLDSIKAALQTTNATGVNRQSPVVMWGYSGGSIATGWAAELRSVYAPDLELAGAAVGGLVNNMTAEITTLNGGPNSGFLPASLSGLSKAYPQFGQAVQSYLLPQYTEQMAAVDSMCVAEDLQRYQNTDVLTWFSIGKDFLNLPVAQQVMSRNIMGEYTPDIPMLVYEGARDEIVPVETVDNIVSTFCNDGAKITYYRDPDTNHTETAVKGFGLAVKWLGQALQGAPVTNCTTIQGPLPTQ
uniref:ARAD1C05984p n=1 Tax=Blastobotrys adeninivorans TaxID=409370 RepID=A0A060T4S2_BLAAD